MGIVIEHLNKVLANSYSLYLKTQSCHWNVEGSNFYAMHLLFEEQYKEQAEAIDVIAERIRALGSKVEANFSYFEKHAKLKENNKMFSLNEMLKDLINSHILVIEKFKELSDITVKFNDKATEDLAIQRIIEHEKQKWMLSVVQN